MGFFTMLFGYEGTVRFEGTTIDGQKFTGKTKIESINMDKQEIEEELKKIIFVETGKRIKEVLIIGAT